MKKYLMWITSLFSCLMLCISTAFAADNTASLTIKESESGHDFTLYQIFSGSVDEDTLSNIEWGSGIDQSNSNFISTYGSDTASTAAKTITDANVNEKISQFKTMLNTANGIEMTQSGDVYKAENLQPGYYLVIDTPAKGASSSNNYSDLIVQVLGDETVSPKVAAPVLNKQVKYNGVWQKGAVYGADDIIEYQSTITLPSNFNDYSTYKLVYTDTLPEGLSWPANTSDSNLFTITFNNQTLTPSTTSINGQTATFTFNNLQNIPELTNQSQILVTYEAKENENVVLGQAGNTNTAKIQYSNAPADTTSMGESSPSTATVYTFKLVINKVNSKGTPLPGAAFQLTKDGAGDTQRVIEKFLSSSPSKDPTTFVWTGLRDGTYTFTETTTPDGYNTFDTNTFQITAALGGTDGQQLESLNVTGASAKNIQIDTKNGTITADVVNTAGTQLPTTGSTGLLAVILIGAVGFAVFAWLKRKA